jgi:hypothetical protein
VQAYVGNEREATSVYRVGWCSSTSPCDWSKLFIVGGGAARVLDRSKERFFN